MGAENQMWLTDGAGTYTTVTFTDIVTDVAVSHGAVIVSIPKLGDGCHLEILHDVLICVANLCGYVG